MFDDDDSDLLDLSKWRAKNEQPIRNESEGNMKARLPAQRPDPVIKFVGATAKNKPKQTRIKLTFD